MQVGMWILLGVYLMLAAAIGAHPSVPRIAKYFGTKGRYEEVNPHLLEDILAVNASVLRPPSPTCRPRHLTAMVRHGTRYPTGPIFKEMQNMYQAVKGASPAKESWLRDIQSQWDMWYTEDMDGRLARKGVDDLKHLAVRLAKLFPSLLTEENLKGGRLSFTSSSKHRCINSTRAFRAGLTELWHLEDQFYPAVNDALMKHFENCPKFLEEVVKNPSALTEVDKFKEGPEMKKVREKIADQLGVPHETITADMADGAFNLCAYELAIKTLSSPWCLLFTLDHAQVVEYANDLRQFWKRGYGHDINRKSSCILFHDVFSRLDKAAADIKADRQVSEAVTVQVGHGETLLPLYTLLGFFKDPDAPTSSNYATQTGRSFRTSEVLPYAANLLLVLYDCGPDQLHLQALVNERPAVFPGLAEHAPLYRDVKERYQELIHGCDHETECELFPRTEAL
ncbi:multiple inositol polyphosphate phosphatase 1-like [Nerophis ophidion]|uniref:multiple inositol polyphosphate phosphatase 1-like n=1 Tax=Nerophis ophidion TaxID=159077 RepID=UPI002ADFCA44|nr:multiple inositol polyphosphate phosphatase 1-like [Nerophis ophidion]